MKRKEMFEIIKKNDWNKEIVAMFGRNMTQVSSENLSMFITNKSIKQAKEAEEKEKKEKETPEEKTVTSEDINISLEEVKKGPYVSKVAFIELISILQSEACIKGKEAERILKLI